MCLPSTGPWRIHPSADNINIAFQCQNPQTILNLISCAKDVLSVPLFTQVTYGVSIQVSTGCDWDGDDSNRLPLQLPDQPSRTAAHPCQSFRKTRCARLLIAAHTTHGCPWAIRFIFINTAISRGHLSLVVPTADISPSPPHPTPPPTLPIFSHSTHICCWNFYAWVTAQNTVLSGHTMWRGLIP